MEDTKKTTRYFLPAPILKSAAEALLTRLKGAKPEVRQPLLVLPSARAVRAIKTHLGAFAEHVTACTPGEVCEVLLAVGKAAPAEILTRVWTTVLKEAALRESPNAVEQQPLGASARALPVSAARSLVALRDELSSAGLDIQALLERFSNEIPAGTQQQLERLSHLEQRYEELLIEAEFEDRWMARRVAWESRSWRTNCDSIFLIACAEISPFVQTVLSSFPGEVSAFIAADPSHAPSFNALGALQVPAPGSMSTWEPGEFNYTRASAIWEVCESIAEQTSEAVSKAQTSAVGVINRADRHVISAYLNEREISCRDGHGISLTTTTPWQLLSRLTAFCASRSADDLAALLATLELSSKVGEFSGAVRIELDQFVAREVPLTITAPNSPGVEVVGPLLELIASLQKNALPSADFLTKIQEFLPPYQSADLECWERLSELLPIMIGLPQTDGFEGLQATLAALATTNHEPRGDPSQVELFGWLEVFLDESPLLFVVNPSAELIPGPPTTNPFLPEGLRRLIGLPTLASRSERDRYRWWYITHSGRSVHVALEQSGSRGEPLLLSPCFIPVHDTKRAAQVLLVKGERSDASSASEAGLGTPLPRFEFPAPQSVSVSGVGDYITCPYRFALKHILQLSPIPDTAHEFDALRFGSILHAVLDSIVSSELNGRSFKVKEQLLAAMFAKLDREVASSEERAGGATIQLESLRNRLTSYADWHLDFRNDGWKPVASELPFEILSPSGLPVCGRIDRVERHSTTGEIMLLDVKTSESEKTVEAFHRPAGMQGKWTSLQLPLYRIGWSLRNGVVDSDETLRLGLLFIDGASNVTLKESKWSEEDFDEAYEQFVAATTGISAAVFWPPSETLQFDPFPFVDLFHRGEVKTAGCSKEAF